MNKVLSIVVCAIGFSSYAYADVDCAAFSKAIVDAQKSISLSVAESMTDRSAVRATYSETKIANSLALIRIHIDEMIQNKCPLPSVPLRANGGYLLAAASCNLMLLRASPSIREQGLPDCDQSKWAPDK